MDNTIGDLFKEKNQKILLDKLLLDIANNDNSLRLIVNNRVNLISLKFQKRINDFFKNNSVNYDVKTLENLVDEYKTKIIEIVNSYLDSRKNILNSIVQEGKDDISNEKSDDEKDKILEDFNKIFNEVIYIEMYNSFLSTFKFNDSEQQEELVDKFLKKYDFDLSNSMVECIFERNQVLKNIIAETKNKVGVLNEMTSNKYLEKKNN